NVIGTKTESDKKVPELNQLVIPYGKTSEIYLSDGTKVYLNAGSRLIYPEFFVDKKREVFLVGEAFFKVSHQKEHPFIVQTTDVKVKVLGTQFNLSAYPSDNIIETVLTEGRVRLEQNNSRLFGENTELQPGQLGAFNKTTRETHLEHVDPDNYVLWKDGIFKFESTDLSRVTKKLERFYNLRFHYGDPLLGTIKISGKLEFSNITETLNRVATVASVNIEQKGEDYFVISECK
ncbi:MAG: FecR family protein, partial [Bacteroidota bacterium]